jgi:hypothetical protein
MSAATGTADQGFSTILGGAETVGFTATSSGVFTRSL